MCVCVFVSGNETVFLIIFFFFKKVPRLTLVVDLFVLDKSCVFFFFYKIYIYYFEKVVFLALLHTYICVSVAVYIFEN